jgi:hypothetical protein
MHIIRNEQLKQKRAKPFSGLALDKTEPWDKYLNLPSKMVGVAGFEPTTP